MIEQRRLDKTVPIPLYFQLKSILLEEIKNGVYPVDSPIPTEKELAELFQISRTTIRQAITELVREGWLYRIKSKGTFVARVKIKQDFIKRLETFNEQIARTGCVPSTEVLRLEVAPYPEQVAARVGRAAGEKAICLDRKRCADGEPIVTVETYLPYETCAFLLEHDMQAESMYDVLATRVQTRICRVTRVLEAVAATARDAQTLHIARGKPIHLFRTVGFNQADEPVEYSVARYRGDRNRFEVDLLIETGAKKDGRA